MAPSTTRQIRVTIEKSHVERAEFYFVDPFRLGRDETCDVQVSDPKVSRIHAEFWFENGQWWVHDLQSANGTYVDGRKVERAPLPSEARLQLGTDGPIVSLVTKESLPMPEKKIEDHSMTHYVQRYFTSSSDEEVGKRTMMIRRAFEKVQKKEKKKYIGAISLVVCLFLLASGYALYKHMENRKQRLLAEDIFYAMKSLELDFAGLLTAARLSEDPYMQKQLKVFKTRREEMKESYEQFVESLDIYGKSISEQERIVLRIARIMGECEINMPEGFAEEVFRYVDKWKETQKFKWAIETAQQKGYISTIAEILIDYDLPPQFFYLALQESNLDVNACGPKTKYGIAKGLWQFIPSTARYYGLRVGPLMEIRRPDPRDERHDLEKATNAASRYLRAIYETDAQASGLLVMASYNWGERRVNELIKNMPENPRERNFWRVLVDHKNEIPKQTYDYVFLIISAAVIGENPGLFGFDFENPLAGVVDNYTL
jgi:pSer/pThr/pTyr-binding forkhead associated (FHA) protein/soluble lytic murein transglycosylase-like protein